MTVTAEDGQHPRGGDRPTGGGLLRQLISFGLVGGVATLAFALVYNAMRLFAEPFAANAVAIVSSSLLNFAMNRRLTFRWVGLRLWFRQLTEFSAVLAVTLGASSAGLAVLFRLYPDPGLVAENVAVIAASGLLFLVRFWLLRIWVFHDRRR